MRETLVDAALSSARGNLKRHKANVEVYLANPVGIGEHPQFTEELDKLVNIVSTAEENIKTLNKHYGENNG